MSTFYLLPTRTSIAQRYADFLHTIIPEINCDTGDLLAGLEDLANSRGAYLVFRDDLPDDVDTIDALQECFGAAEQDRVISVEMTIDHGEPEA